MFVPISARVHHVLMQFHVILISNTLNARKHFTRASVFPLNGTPLKRRRRERIETRVNHTWTVYFRLTRLRTVVIAVYTLSVRRLRSRDVWIIQRNYLSSPAARMTRSKILNSHAPSLERVRSLVRITGPYKFVGLAVPAAVIGVLIKDDVSPARACT